MLHPNLDFVFKNLFPYERREDGDFGIELEIEGTGLPGEVSGWKIKPEPSLRGDGLEYITKGSYDLKGLDAVLTKLSVALSKPNCTVTPSPRCSTHIHINFQREKMGTYLGFLMVAMIVEPVLLRLCGPERNGNVFCMPTYETAEVRDHARKMVKHLAFKAGYYDPYHWPSRGKYASFNTDCIPTFGSVEARCFPLSVDKDQILTWIGWLQNMLGIARSWPDRTFKSLLNQAFNDPIWMVTEVFGAQPGLMTVCAPNNFVDMIRMGVENAYEIYRECRPVFEYNPEKVKEGKTVGKKKPKKAPQSLWQDEAPSPVWGSQGYEGLSPVSYVDEEIEL